MTNKQIKKKYDQLMNDVAKNPYYTNINMSNRTNCYVCNHCHNVMKTIDVDRGVTPFMIRCHNCGEMAYSQFYKNIAPSRLPTMEWYRPSLNDLLKNKHKYDIGHVLNGGLELRKIIN
jgi:transcription elongation factor Elf1